MIPAADIERARSIRLEDELRHRRITLRRVGTTGEMVGPCPKCGGEDRFSINIKERVWNCRICKPDNIKGDVIGLVQHLDGCGVCAAIRTLIGESRSSTTTIVRPVRSETRADGDEVRNLKLAAEIFQASSPLGPEAIAYFAAGRRIDIDAVPEHGGLRFHARCPWEKSTLPCIVGRFTTAISNQPRGI